MGEQNQSTEILSSPDLFVQLFNVRNTQISTIFFPKKYISNFKIIIFLFHLKKIIIIINTSGILYVIITFDVTGGGNSGYGA